MKCALRIVGCLFIALAGCGRVGLDPDLAERADAGAPDTHAPVPDAGRELPPVGPPFALVVRMTNRTDGDVPMYFRPSEACGDDIFIQGAAPFEEWTSIQTPDVSCDCTDCSASNGRPRCQSTEFICDQPPLVLHPGDHLDFPWDGIVLTWLPSPPAGSACLGRCSAFVPVPAGDYVFTLAQSFRVVSVASPVPPPGGVVHIPIDFR